MKRSPEREKDGQSAFLSLIVPGTVLAGKFQIVRKLGRGGMGLVIEAHHMELDERVALKFLQSTGASDPVRLQRFYREARAAAKIKSEHVTRVLDVGKLETGEPYMVLEHLSGIDLSKHLKIHGKLPITTAVDYVIQAMDAVAEAHANGIIHRDLKPSNLFLADRPDGTRIVKVLDFGIAKQSDGDGSGLTDTALVFGSMVYMSPEQTKSTRDVDERTDIYSLGITLYELCAGRPPFFAKLVPEIMAQKAQGNATPLRELVPSAPEALEKVLEKAFERDVERRYVSMAEFAQALAPFASDESKHLLTRIARVTEHTTKSFPRAKILPELREFAKEIELELGVDLGPEPSPQRVPEWSDEWSDEYSLKDQRGARGKPLALVKSGDASSSAPPPGNHPDSTSRPAVALPGALPGRSVHTSSPPLTMAELVPDKAPSTARSPTFPPPPVVPVDGSKLPAPPPLPDLGSSLAPTPPPPTTTTPPTTPLPEPLSPPPSTTAVSASPIVAPGTPVIIRPRPSLSVTDAPDAERPPRLSRAVIVLLAGSIAVGAGVGVFFGLRRAAPDAPVELRTNSLDNVGHAGPPVTPAQPSATDPSLPAALAPSAAPAAALAPTSAPSALSSPALAGLRHPCPLGTKAANSCASGTTAWCDSSEERVACCDPALTPSGEGDACGCPQGGPLLPKATSMGCKLPPDAPMITPASIGAAFAAKQAELGACLPAPLPGAGNATTAVVVVALEIAADGRVFEAHIQASSTKSAEAQACVVAVAKSIRFPPPPSRGMRFIQPLRIPTAK